ncbi:hypothetical protein KKC08_04155 [Patescibacteria group bacterium]|nr:hypothetical protein [Patescibacteria group bacterium]MCG2702315.1 hypothetical protein [Candidatus Parcubacteria bacterium]MBU4264595.1 hypothetical protein [Patescibacteria group bacterium]MBU4390263.1 hypothetical protein [Patescibacteria group bacterium]MBU4397333.1 hypothetical protein [Patescibacteria group bacterium]
MKRKTAESLEGRIVQAIRNGETDQLVSRLRQANSVLTGSQQGHFSESSAKDLDQKVADFLDKAKGGYATTIVYLGDCGLSRLCLSVMDDETKVEPTYNSTDSVKKRWEQT